MTEGGASKISTDIMPMASDCMGNVFAFLANDLKEHMETAAIYFYDNDFDTLDKIAESFTEWIDNLNKI